LHGHRLASEEISNEYGAQTMFFQSQDFLIEKARFCRAFLIFKKAKCVKKVRISKSGFKKVKLATLLSCSCSGGTDSCPWAIPVITSQTGVHQKPINVLAF